MAQIISFGPELEEYVRDESRTVGEADSISFPTSEDDVRDVLRSLHAAAVPVTVQGARTGLAAGAVPHGGHVMNLSRMDRVLGLRQDDDGRFYVRVQPGVVLANLRKQLAGKSCPPWAGATRAWQPSTPSTPVPSSSFPPTPPRRAPASAAWWPATPRARAATATAPCVRT